MAMLANTMVIYWFPKVFGFKLNEFWAKTMFWLFSAGTVLVLKVRRPRYMVNAQLNTFTPVGMPTSMVA